MSAKTGENVEELFERILDNLDNVKCHNYHSSLEKIEEHKEADNNVTGNKLTNSGQEKLPELPDPIQLTTQVQPPA